MAAEVAEEGDNGRRMRELLSSFYGSGGGSSDAAAGDSTNLRDKLESIDLSDFDVDQYLQALLEQTPLDRVIQRHADIGGEITALDGDMQTLVYENYNKFISATTTIRTMKENVAGMQTNMLKLLDAVTAVRTKSDAINSSLCERRECIEKLNGTQSVLRKIQFVFDLPQRLRKCMKADDHVGAVRHYLGALPFLQAYGKSSLQTCKQESEDIIGNLKKRLQDQVMDASIPVVARAKAVSLLKQLNHPVESLVEAFLAAHWDRLLGDLGVSKPTMVKKLRGFLGLTADKALADAKGEALISPQEALVKIEESFIFDFIETAATYRELFPSHEKRLGEAATKLFDEYFACVQRSLQRETGSPSSMELLAAFGVLSKDVTKLIELVPDSGLLERASKAVENAIKQHVAVLFGDLCDKIKAVLVIPDPEAPKNDEVGEQRTLRACLVQSQRTIIQSSLDVLQDLKILLDKNEDYLARWRDEYIDLIQAGFHELFVDLLDHFQWVCVESGRSWTSISESTVKPSLVLLLALLSVYIYQTAVPKITEVVGAWFIGGGAMGSEARPAFVPSEICRYFYAIGDRLLRQYVDVTTHHLVLLVRKSVGAPQWLKYPEVKEVRPFTDLLLQEVMRIDAEVQQLLDPGVSRRHRRAATPTPPSGSGGGPSSSRTSSLTIKGDYLQRAATRSSKVLERDVAKLFSQRVELFTKIEYTQASVVSNVVKLALKTFLECVRLETFNRNGFQQVQLDAHYLREPLRNMVENEAVVDTLLDEVCSAASERCLEPVPLDTTTLDKMIQSRSGRRVSTKAPPM